MRTRKIAIVAVLVVSSLVIAVTPSEAWWHRGWWVPPFWVWAPPPVVVAPAPAPVVVTPAPVIESAPVYSQQETPQGYWYFCPSSRAYYPSVQTCSEAWVKVPPRVQQ